MRYPYIAIEGVIGAGKTTFANFLAKHYDFKLLLEEFEENPFLEKFYANPEQFSFPLEISFLASRYHQVKNQIKKMELFQEGIISDFVLYKSMVFASLNLKGDELNLYKKLFQIMFQQIPTPDLIVYIYRSIESLQENIKKRGRDYEMNISDSYLENLNKNYLAYFKRLSHHRIVIINGEDFDIISDKKNKDRLIEIIETDFPLGVTYFQCI